MYNKYIAKLFIILLLVFFTVCLFTQSVSAHYCRLGTGKISGGAQGLKYYISSSASGYQDSLNNGITRWNGITDKVSFSRTYTQSLSKVDCYWADYFTTQSGIIAETQLMKNNVRTYDFNTDWVWCKLLFDSEMYNITYPDYSHRKAIATHETGHFLGLAHTGEAVDEVTDIMYPYGYDCTATAPCVDETYCLILIYGT